MTLPPTRYIDAGPGVPLADPSSAMAQGKAYAQMGATIAAIGEKGMEIAGKIRVIDETTKLTEFFQQAEMKAAEFSDSLMTRHDHEKFPADWEKINSKLRLDLRNLGVSPQALKKAEIEFADWTTRKTIRLESEAAAKTVEMGRKRTIDAADYHFQRGELEQGRKVLGDAGTAGLLSPLEIEQGVRRGEEVAATNTLIEDIERDPQTMLELLESGDYLATTPGADLQLVERGKRQARAVIQRYRGEEMDQLEADLGRGRLKARDIEAARYLSEKDRVALTSALTTLDPPGNEAHAAAWDILWKLREAREDSSITPEKYRELWNEARGGVLGKIPPQWQGDLKKELSYLSPAGRSTDGTSSAAYTTADLEAVGRNIAFRARDAGFFGNIAEDATPAEKEKAFRRAEDIRLEVKRWLATQRDASPAAVREFTDGLISGDRIKDTARELRSFVPGTGQRFRAAPTMPALPSKQGAKDKAAADPLDIPPGATDASDALLPARQQLETFLNQ